MNAPRQNDLAQAPLADCDGRCGAPQARKGAAGKGRFGLPLAARSRLVVLLATLVLIKLVLLIALRRHLEQTHWRVGAPPATWLGFLGFAVVLLAGLSTLALLSRQCQAVGVRAVRRVNATVLGLGLLLILLTFHQGDKNYLYPILSGVLKWSSLVPYLSMDFFFHPPYLAAWLLGYAACYYVMVRLRRESHTLTLTCVFAVCYWVAHLREFLERGFDLWVAALFGLVALALLLRPNLRFRPAWWLAPLGWTLLIWGLLALRVRELAHPSKYFQLLLCVAMAVFAAGTWLARQAGVSQPWLKALGFYALAFLLLANCNHPLAENYNNLIRFSATFPHYFLGEICMVGFAAALAILYARVRPRGSFWWLDGFGLALIFLALVDLRLAQVMGVRLGWDVLHFGNSPTMMWKLAKPYLPGLIGVLFGISLAYAAGVRGVGWMLRRPAYHNKPERPGGEGWLPVGGVALLAVLGLAIAKPDDAQGQSAWRLLKSSPLGKRAVGRVMSPEEFHRAASELGIVFSDGERAAPTVPARTNLNVLLILQESAYNRFCSLFSGTEETQPLLAKYRERMEVFPNFFSSFQGSIQARFATFTGLYPVGDFNVFTLNRVVVRSIFEVLHENGYACSIFYSSFGDYTGFRSFLNGRGVDELYDADNMPGERKTGRVSWGLREDETLGAIRMQLRKQATRPGPFFLTYIPAAPHYPYENIPEAFRRFPRLQLGDFTSAYLNEMLFMDWVITSIVDELKETGLLDRTLVVITSDHGEMLGGAENPIGHGWKVTPELVNVPLILLHPSRPGYRVNHSIGSQVDLLPTLLDELGIPRPPEELYQGRSLRSGVTTDPASHLIYLNSFKEYAVISGDHFWKGDRSTESASAGGGNFTAFQISNHGPQTLFTPSTNKIATAVAIRRFDKFQENLLRNYTFYRNSLRNHPPAGSGRGSK